LHQQDALRLDSLTLLVTDGVLHDALKCVDAAEPAWKDGLITAPGLARPDAAQGGWSVLRLLDVTSDGPGASAGASPGVRDGEGASHEAKAG
jgi:hypothetical protein